MQLDKFEIFNSLLYSQVLHRQFTESNHLLCIFRYMSFTVDKYIKKVIKNYECTRNICVDKHRCQLAKMGYFIVWQFMNARALNFRQLLIQAIIDFLDTPVP